MIISTSKICSAIFMACIATAQTANLCTSTITTIAPTCAATDVPEVSNNIGSVVYTTTYTMSLARCAQTCGTTTIPVTVVQVSTGIPTPVNTNTIPSGFIITTTVCPGCGGSPGSGNSAVSGTTQTFTVCIAGCVQATSTGAASHGNGSPTVVPFEGIASILSSKFAHGGLGLIAAVMLWL
jgi:hypothetical protein